MYILQKLQKHKRNVWIHQKILDNPKLNSMQSVGINYLFSKVVHFATNVLILRFHEVNRSMIVSN